MGHRLDVLCLWFEAVVPHSGEGLKEEVAQIWEVQDAEAKGCQHSGSLFLFPFLFHLRP